MLDVAYVGNVGRHLGQTVQINSLAPGTRFLASSLDKTTASSPLPDNFLRPYYGYGNLPYLEFAGTSNYHSLQTQVRRSFSRGLQVNLAWTWSKAMNYGDGYNDGVSRFYDRRVWNYGPSSSDRTHTVVANWVWDIPKATRLWKNPVIQWAFDNWQFSGIAAFATGMVAAATQCSSNPRRHPARSSSTISRRVFRWASAWPSRRGQKLSFGNTRTGRRGQCSRPTGCRRSWPSPPSSESLTPPPPRSSSSPMPPRMVSVP